MLKRSVLTEKIARRGLHLTREYSTDPLETFFVSDVVTSPPVTLASSEQVTPELLASLAARLGEAPGQRLIPVTAANGTLTGVTTLRALASLTEDTAGRVSAAEAARPCQLNVSTGQLLREVAYLFAETGLTSAPVTDPATGRVTGVITLPDLLHARLHDLTEENHRERLIPRPPVTAPAQPAPVAEYSRLRGPAAGQQREAGEFKAGSAFVPRGRPPRPLGGR